MVDSLQIYLSLCVCAAGKTSALMASQGEQQQVATICVWVLNRQGRPNTLSEVSSFMQARHFPAVVHPNSAKWSVRSAIVLECAACVGNELEELLSVVRRGEAHTRATFEQLHVAGRSGERPARVVMRQRSAHRNRT